MAGEPPSETAIVVLVPQAEAQVAALRQRHDPAAALGVPAHITVLYPFMALALITPEALSRAAASLRGLRAFDFQLSQLRRFADTCWLAPHPAEPFVALTEALMRAFPAFQPFGGLHEDIVPHLTVARGDEPALQLADAELRAILHEHGPIQAHCSHLSLLSQAGSRWCEWQRLPLDPPAVAGA
jgi:2'-5' RNA ligase